MTAPPTTEEFWDREAGDYDAAHDRQRSARNPLWIRMTVVLGVLGPRPGWVLDCGMGPGRLLLELERHGWSVAGVDLSSEMVARARARVPEAAERLVQGTVESLPFPAESFDAAVATGVLEYVDDVPRALAEVARVLSPGGLFVVGAPNTQAVGTFWRHRIVYTVVRTLKARLRFGRPVTLPRPGMLSRRGLEAQLAAAGLQVERVEFIVSAPTPLRLHFPSVGRRVAVRLGGPRLGPLFGGQFVLSARKPDRKTVG